MGLLTKQNLVEINEKYNPPVKTLREVIFLTGRTRQQIEAHSKLNFGVILANEKVGDQGYKVVIADKELAKFINKCSKKDSLKGVKQAHKELKVAKGTKPSKVIKSLDSLPNEIEVKTTGSSKLDAALGLK